MTWVQNSEPTWWEKKTGSWALSSDRHTHTGRALRWAQINVILNIILKLKNKERNKQRSQAFLIFLLLCRHLRSFKMPGTQNKSHYKNSSKKKKAKVMRGNKWRVSTEHRELKNGWAHWPQTAVQSWPYKCAADAPAHSINFRSDVLQRSPVRTCRMTFLLTVPTPWLFTQHLQCTGFSGKLEPESTEDYTHVKHCACLRDPSACGFSYQQGSWTHSPVDTEGHPFSFLILITALCEVR